MIISLSKLSTSQFADVESGRAQRQVHHDRDHKQTWVLFLPIIAISIYYTTHYGTIIRYYGAIIAIIVLQMSRLLFTIIALSPKRLLLHLWQYYYFTYCFWYILLLLLLLSHYYLHY